VSAGNAASKDMCLGGAQRFYRALVLPWPVLPMHLFFANPDKFDKLLS
jgi:hypothetical protein